MLVKDMLLVVSVFVEGETLSVKALRRGSGAVSPRAAPFPCAYFR
jgi:hypothetical protein